MAGDAPDESLLPKWAVDLTTQIAILNEKIPTHIDWVERTTRDHEARLRDVENSKASKGTTDALATRLDLLEAKSDRSEWAGRIGWLILGAGVAGLIAFVLTRVLPT